MSSKSKKSVSNSKNSVSKFKNLVSKSKKSVSKSKKSVSKSKNSDIRPHRKTVSSQLNKNVSSKIVSPEIKKPDYIKNALSTAGALCLAGITGLSIKNLLYKKNGTHVSSVSAVSPQISSFANIQNDECEFKILQISKLFRKEIENLEDKLKKEIKKNIELNNKLNKYVN